MPHLPLPPRPSPLSEYQPSTGTAGPAQTHRLPPQAIFEIITSEFSYLHSLNILVAQFLRSPELRATMTQMDHHHLFSNILDVLAASQK